MFYIDSSTTTGTSSLASMPTPNSASTTPGWFAHGNASLGVPYTVVTSDFLNSLQAEILNVLSRAGITPSKTNQAQLLQAIQTIGRIKPVTPLSIYVSTTGSNSADGLTSGTALATLQAAVDKIVYNYDLGGGVATINVAAGVYTTGVFISNASCNGSIHIVGNTTTPTNCKIKLPGAGSCIQVDAHSPTISVSGLSFEGGSGSGGSSALVASQGGVIYFDHVAFGAVTGTHINASNGGQITLNGSAYGSTPYTYTIYGGATYHYYCGYSSALLEMTNAQVTINNALTFGTFGFGDAAGMLRVVNWSFVLSSGASVTGIRMQFANGAYFATSGGVIATYLPGSVAGTTTTGYTS